MDQMEVITTAEKIKNMNNLYRAAVRAMKSYFEFWDKPTPTHFKRMQKDISALCDALFKIAYKQAKGGAK